MKSRFLSSRLPAIIALCGIASVSVSHGLAQEDTFFREHDTFALTSPKRAAGKELGGTATEGLGAIWRAHPDFVLHAADDGGETGIVRYEGKGPATLGVPLNRGFVRNPGSPLLLQLRFEFDFGGIPAGPDTWLGVGLGRSSSNITSNGVAWLRAQPDGHWQLCNASGTLASGKAAPFLAGKHEFRLEIDLEDSTLAILIDDRPEASGVRFSGPLLAPRQQPFILMHYQWLDRRVALHAVSAEVLPKAPLALGWLPNSETSDVFDLGQKAALGFALHATRPDTVALRLDCAAYNGTPLHTETRQVKTDGRMLPQVFEIPAEKLTAHGIYKARITATAAGDHTVIEQQFAVIPPRQITPDIYDRLSPYSVNYFRDWRLAARLGAKKVRQTYRSLKEFEGYLPAARANGLLINGPLLDGPIRMRNALPSAIAASTAGVSGMFRDVKTAAGDAVYVQEIYNEPENWPPVPRNNGFIPLAKMIADVTADIRESGLDLKVMSSGTTHANLSFLHQLASVGGTDAADVIAVHGYRSPLRPEFGHDETVAAIRDLFGDKPIYVNEDAYFAWSPPPPGAAPSITSPSGSSIELDEVTQGIYLQRVYLNQLMAGFSLVNQFSGSGANHDLNASRTHRRPGIINYAALTHFLPHPKFVRRLTPATQSLWVLEWETDGQPVTTLWTLNAPERVDLELASDGAAFDTYANPLARSRSRHLSLSVGGAPVFITGTKVKTVLEHRPLSSTDEPPRVALPEEKEDRPLDIRIAGQALSLSRARVSAIIKNTSPDPVRGDVELAFLNKAPEAWILVPETSERIDLAPGQTATLHFRPESTAPDSAPFDPYNPAPGEGYLALYWAEGYQVGVRVRPDDGSPETVRQPNSRLSLRGAPWKAPAAVTIDADLSDWADVPVFRQLGRRKRNVELSRFWTGPQDYFPTFRFAWCDEGLLFAAEVIDDRHDATQKGLDAWRTDSIQLGLNARHESVVRGRPDFLDYSVITLSTSGAVLQRDTPRRQAGPLTEVKLVTRRVEGDYEKSGATYYEALIPWSVLGISPDETAEKQDRQTLGFCVLFNESDGWWRRGWEGYFVPMGGQIVDPRYFGDLTLVHD